MSRATRPGAAAVRLGILLAGLLSAPPAPARDPGVCRTIADAAARASCVAVGRAARAAPARSGPPSVRSLVRPITPGPAEAVGGRDLAAAPDRYVGRTLLLRGGRCRYVDVNRYVCTVADTPPVEIHAHVIMPPHAQVEVEAGGPCLGRSGRRGRSRCETSILLMPSAIRKTPETVVLTTSAIWFRTTR